jgi:GT2 family glycosyltransferase
MTLHESPTVTTIIPTFQRPAMLRRAVASALNQTHRNTVVCVYDNGSDDATRATMEDIARSDHRVRYMRHSENIGYASNFRFGMERVGTDFFSVMSDDDILLPRLYETALRSFAENPEAGFVATQVVRMTETGAVLPVDPAHFPRGYYAPPGALVTQAALGPIIWTGTVFRTAVARAAGLYDPTVGIAGDWEFQLRLSVLAPFLVLDAPGAIFVAHSGSLSGSADGSGALSSISERPRLYQKMAQYNAPQHLIARAMDQLRARDRRTLVRCYLSGVSQGDAELSRRVGQVAAQVLGDRWLGGSMRRGAAILSTTWSRGVAELILGLRYRRRLQEALQRDYGHYNAHL